MWFKNLRVYSGAWPVGLLLHLSELARLEEGAKAREFTPCGKLDAAKEGFVPVIGGAFVHVVDRCLFFKLRRQEKKVPASAVAEEAQRLADQCGAITVGRKQRQLLREEAFINLLPRAFTTDTYTLGFIHCGSGRLFIDASSPTRAESFMHFLRDLLGSLPCRPVETNQRPSAVMTEWLSNGAAPLPFELGATCALGHKDGREVKMWDFAADSEGMRSQLAEGLVVDELAVQWAGKVRFTLTSGLTLRGVKFTDAVADEVHAQNHEEEMDARAFIMSRTLASCLTAVLETFGGEAAHE